MSNQESERQGVPAPTLTALPRVEDLPRTDSGGYSEEGVREAFESFRRHALQLQAREITANAEREANQELREAEARAARLIEQSRHQATELTNAARAEVEQTLEWARAQAGVIIGRAQQGAEQLLGAAGLSADNM